MEPWLQIILTTITSVLASSGLWAYLTKKKRKKRCKN